MRSRAWCQPVGRPDLAGPGRLVALVLIVVALLGCSPSPPDEASMEVRLQGAVDDYVERRLVPGASVAVIDHGALTEVVAGVADIDTDQAVTPGTQFRVASVTKMYVAAAVLELVEAGELSLDRPISGYGVHLPERLAFVEGLTLRQLLSHTTGLAQTFTRDEDRHRRLSLSDLVDRIPAPACAPGSCWSYADGNYVITQLVLETVTGQDIVDVLDQLLLEPLGLTGTAMIDAAVVDTALPSQYALVSDESGQAVEPRRLFEQALPRSATLVTTADDAAGFARQLFSGEVLDAGTLAEMLDTTSMRSLPCAQRCPFDYGLGVFHYDVGGRHLVGHDGSSGTIVAYDQDDDLAIALLTNGGDADMGQLLEAVLSAIEATDPPLIGR